MSAFERLTHHCILLLNLLAILMRSATCRFVRRNKNDNVTFVHTHAATRCATARYATACCATAHSAR